MKAVQTSDIAHATCVAVEGQGVLILGTSGAGKSSFALQLMALGADLVADDRTVLISANRALWASVPPSIAGMIEARGVGILHVPHLDRVQVRLIVDLDRTETQRLPAEHFHTLHGITLPCLFNAPSAHFAAAVLLYLKATIDGGG